MKIAKITLLSLVAVALVFSFALAGDVAKGKALFNDPALGGATAGKSCGTCHPNGKGLENFAHKTEFKFGGKVHKTLEDAINACIEKANKGKALDPKSDQMKDLVAYLKSLKPKAEEPKKK
jgi:cytochrome c553